ncbi:MAG: succinate dehydrogenase/fumarate reductase iron-sulfur subunit [Bdellovibrionaceae bacterium]|nr:succinate dehydrogenase/fumarate reductase iron-sulfur subunit [Bdellovibrionales bacterium]MCB9085432.1 succinate dehydrogenase/fumarate reductase iron-sulfur subunit [Pseudobdellovibrionaceae bacterium]
MNLKLKIWRQKSPKEKGFFMEYDIKDVSSEASFLEMLDVVNEELVKKGEDPVEFDHDCREGICGMCSLVINGNPHGPDGAITTCQLHMRRFKDGDTITIEPFRAGAFPVVRDLVVDRSSLDRVIQSGGFVSAATGTAQDANCLPVGKEDADRAFQAAACIGCGACVAACKNASASLFVSAKVAHLALLPQGEAERNKRALAMVRQMDTEGFGGCTNTGACSAACPKEISLEHIAILNREFLRASILER